MKIHAAVLFMAITIPPVAPARAPQSFPLVCRGSDKSAEGYGIDILGDEQAFTLKFRKAANRADSGLPNGHCSWVDRAVSADEPNIVFHSVKGRNTDKYPVVYNDPDFGWLKVLVNEPQDQYWTFWVYNDGKGRLVVTSSRSGRPFAEKLQDVRLPAVVRPDVDVAALAIPDLSVAAHGFSCPNYVNLVHSGPAITESFVVRLNIYKSKAEQELLKSFDVTVPGVSSSRQVFFNVPLSGWVRTAAPSYFCRAILDATNKIQERSKKNNQAEGEIPLLTDASEAERQRKTR